MNYRNSSERCSFWGKLVKAMSDSSYAGKQVQRKRVKERQTLLFICFQMFATHYISKCILCCFFFFFSSQCCTFSINFLYIPSLKCKHSQQLHLKFRQSSLVFTAFKEKEDQTIRIQHSKHFVPEEFVDRKLAQ